ncbi:MAG: hypothetical protein HY435_00430 [Candidatus Liptonbacteria bacterium]|nr:hypothetical protein [Candidatus Liptonbacteria bacterium]
MHSRITHNGIVQVVFVAVALAAITFVAAGFFPIARAATPLIVNYQGRLENSDGNLVGGSAGQAFDFKFSIWNSATVASGTRLWPASAPASTTHTITKGVFDARIGDTAQGFAALDLDFNTSSILYLQVEVWNVTSTAFETLAPRQPIVSTGFAINADTVDGAHAGTGASNVLKLDPSGGINLPGGSSTFTGSVTITGSTTLAVVSSTNISASGYGLFPTLRFTNASGTNLTASGFLQGANLNVSGISALQGFTFTNATGTTLMLQGTAGLTGNILSVASSSGNNFFLVSSSGTSMFSDGSNNKILTITPGTPTNNIFEVGSSTETYFAVAKSGQTIVSSTLLVRDQSTLASVSSTNITASGYGLFPTLRFTNASGTNLTASGFLQGATLNISGQSSLTSVSSTNITASGYGRFPTLTFTNASGTNLSLTGNLNVGTGTTNSVAPFFPASNQLITVARTFSDNEAKYGIKIALDSSTTIPITNEIVGVDTVLSTELNNIASTTGNLIAYRADLQDWAGAGTLSNYYGFQNTSGLTVRTLTNSYGFYHSGSSPAQNPWAFYAVSDPSFFGGGATIAGHTTSTNASTTNLSASGYLQGANLNVTGAGTAAVFQNDAQVKGRFGVGALGGPSANTFISVNEQLAPAGTTEVVALDLGFGTAMTSTRSAATIGVRGRVNILGTGANSASYSGDVIGVTGEVRNSPAQVMSLKNAIGFWAGQTIAGGANASSVINFYSTAGIISANRVSSSYGFYHTGIGNIATSSRYGLYVLGDRSYLTELENAGNATTTSLHVSSTLNVVATTTLRGTLTVATSSQVSTTSTLTVCANSNCTLPSAVTSTDTVAFFASTRGTTTSTSITARGTITGGMEDIGEFVHVTGNPSDYTAGDVLSFSTSEPGKFQKSKFAYDPLLAGIVTETAGLVAGGGVDNRGTVIMALAGRLPIKVTGENGAIAVGDALTSSSESPGYAMKATGTGRVVAIAMEAFAGGTARDLGKILAFANLGHRYVTAEPQGGSIPPIQSSQFTGFIQNFNVDPSYTYSFENLKVQNLTVGSSDEPSGFTIFDRATGAPTCVFVENGAIKTSPGACSPPNPAPENQNNPGGEGAVDDGADTPPDNGATPAPRQDDPDLPADTPPSSTPPDNSKKPPDDDGPAPPAEPTPSEPSEGEPVPAPSPEPATPP